MKKIIKKITRKEMVDLSLILGQMTNSQSATMKNNEYVLISKNVIDDWFEKIKNVLEKNL